jgi:integrase
MPLTEAQCKNAACPEGKTKARLSDSGGLYLEVAPNGSKRWFWKYRFAGKEKRLALGSHPDTSLKSARLARDAARLKQQDGTDPAQERRLNKLTKHVSTEDSFEPVARELHAKKKHGWSKQYGERWIERMEKDLFPWLGTLRLTEITAPVLLQTLRRVEARGARETAHTLRQTAGQVFRYGIQTGRAERDPAADLHGALEPVIVKHMASVLEPERVGDLVRAMRGYSGQPTTRTALMLSALLFQRPGNIRAMEWAHVDLESAMWTIPAKEMKRTVHGKLNGRPHLVPLAPQAVALLTDLKPLTGHGRYVFPGLQSHERPMSENTVNVALRRLGFSGDEMVAHGFRSMARTLMVEHTDIPADVIEAQLAHTKSGPLGAAYDRAEYLAQRRRMMKTWADYLDKLAAGAEVIPLRAKEPRRPAAGK